MSRLADPVGAALLAPLHEGWLPVPMVGRVLFANARALPAMPVPTARLVCEQDFKPYADLLDPATLAAPADCGERFALALLLPHRQRDQLRCLLAETALRLAADGVLLCAAANNEGARSLQTDAERLLGPLQQASLHKCRVLWSRPGERVLDHSLAAEWIAAAAPRVVAGTRLLSAPGVFSFDHIDPGSALLVARLPVDLAGAGADLGAGWGYLSSQLLLRCPRVTSLDLYEADARALALARRNLHAQCDGSAARTPLLDFHWLDVTAGLDRRYDFIVSNPPFHVGHAGEPELGRRFIAVAAEALNPGGRLLLVANRHLPYEAALAKAFSRVDKCAEMQGFKVFEAIR